MDIRNFHRKPFEEKENKELIKITIQLPTLTIFRLRGAARIFVDVVIETINNNKKNALC